MVRHTVSGYFTLLRDLNLDVFFYNCSMAGMVLVATPINLKEQSRPSVSNVKSADVRLATGIGTATSLDNVTNSVYKT